MMIALFILAFIVGLFIGIPTAPYVSPQSPTTIILVMVPFLFLYFFSENPTLNTIRYLYLALAVGIFTYWIYFQIKLSR